MAKNTGTKVLVVLGFIGVLALLSAMVYMIYGLQQTSFDGQTGSAGISAPGVCSTPCPDDLTWSGNVDVNNVLNQSGEETYDTTMYFFNYNDGNLGGLKTKLTDTTDGTATLTCGNTYLVEVISTDGDGGDSAEILAGPQGVEITDDGSAIFTACGDGENIVFNMNQRGVPEVRARDVINDGFLYDYSSDEDASDYETTDGVVFTSTSGNTTNYTIDSSGEFHIIQYIRANSDDTDFNDLGIYVLIDASSSVYEEPTVKIDGVVAENAKEELNSDEAIAYSDYEYVYKIGKDRQVTKNNPLSVEVNGFALSGVNPAVGDDISIDYAVIGKYASTSETNTIKIGAVKDDSSKTQVYNKFDTELRVA
ncbi:MAG: hypothetical protein ACOCV1_00040 [Bacillota bacterium]